MNSSSLTVSLYVSWRIHLVWSIHSSHILSRSSLPSSLSSFNRYVKSSRFLVRVGVNINDISNGDFQESSKAQAR